MIKRLFEMLIGSTMIITVPVAIIFGTAEDVDKLLKESITLIFEGE